MTVPFVSTAYSTSLLPLQQTYLCGVSSVPTNRMNYATLDHSFVIAPNIKMGVTGSYTDADPGYTLKPFNIQSQSSFLAMYLSYQWIRQHQENLTVIKFTIDGRDVNSDILDKPLTRDNIRTARVNATYDMADGWRGYNTASVTFSQGIDGLGSSVSRTLTCHAPKPSRTSQKGSYLLRERRASPTIRLPDWPLLARWPRVCFTHRKNLAMVGKRLAVPTIPRKSLATGARHPVQSNCIWRAC